MTQLEKLFKRQSYLSALSLGALGNLLEFTIHNQMHMRWSSISRDPTNNDQQNETTLTLMINGMIQNMTT